MHHKAINVGVSQISLILGIRFSARGIRDFLGTFSNEQRLKQKGVRSEVIIVTLRILFTKKHLQHLNSARLQASVFDKLAHFI